MLLLLSGLPLAAQEVALLQKAEVMIVRPGEAAPAFACAEEDCERLAWLPAGASVVLIGQLEGRELEDSAQWVEVLLDCPCFDYERRTLADLPDTKDPDLDRWYSWHPYWSPDSSRIATVVGSVLHVWDTKSGERLVKEPLDIFHAYHMAWSPDGTRIVAAGGYRFDEEDQIHYEPKRNLLLVSADGRNPLPLPGQDKGVWHVAWSHDGTRIATAGQELRIQDAQQGISLLSIDSSTSVVDWSPDDTSIVAISHDIGLQVWDATSGELLSSLGGGDVNHIADVAWSPDGARIAFTSYEVTERESDSNLVTGSALRLWDGVGQHHPETLLEDPDWVFDISWSPDSRFLVTQIRGAVSILDVDDGRVRARLTAAVNPYTRDQDGNSYLMGLVDWSPDGKHIAATGQVFVQEKFELHSAALVWDLTLIPEGQTRAFIHSSQLIPDAAADG